MSHPPVLLVTSVFPPGHGGSAALLYELLRHFPPRSLVVVHQDHGVSSDPTFRLPFDATPVSIFGSQRWTDRVLRRAPWIIQRLMARVIDRTIRQYGVQRIYAHYPDAIAVTSAWQAARKYGLPLTVYFDILWEEATRGYDQQLAKKYERLISEYADRRFAITEFAADYLSKKHGLTWDCIPHTIDVRQLPDGFYPVPARSRPVIHFAGTVYPKMNKDSLDRLALAVSVSKSKPILDICSRYRFEIPSTDVQYRFLSRVELVKAQRQADILFLPQAFESTAPEMIRHNMPTKVMEYLVSGRPILVHSPADSYLTWLARQEGFALVVDQPGITALANAIDELISNTTLQATLVANALNFARKRDSSHLWRNLYLALFNSNPDDNRSASTNGLVSSTVPQS